MHTTASITKGIINKHANSYLGKESEEKSRPSSSFSSSVEKPSISPLSLMDLKEIFTVR